VIKGRGIDQLGEYLTVERTGRRFAFPEAYRRQVWDLHQRWEEEMSTRKTRDFADVIRTALDLAKADGKAEYRGAIIDEAQDLTLTGLNLVRSLVNGDCDDPSDGLLLVGDGAQRIYTSCYTLRQAGLEVRGRTTILKRNYRNAKPIIAAAMAVAGDRTIDDLGDEFERGDAEAVSELEGARPRVFVCADLDSQWDRIATELRSLVESDAAGYGDIGILLPVNEFAFSGANKLRKRGFPVLNLKDFSAHSTDEIRIGTYHRAKGLEFKVVILPDVSAGRLPSPQRKTENDDAYQERLDMEMSAFYVAMSRARDQLVLTCTEAPAAAIAGAKAHFDFE
jgi:superfamily I DNA/RNA helicase